MSVLLAVGLFAAASVPVSATGGITLDMVGENRVASIASHWAVVDLNDDLVVYDKSAPGSGKVVMHDVSMVSTYFYDAFYVLKNDGSLWFLWSNEI
jgi:hypothetical protein